MIHITCNDDKNDRPMGQWYAGVTAWGHSISSHHSSVELQTFSKLASERVPSECRHCRLTSDIFIKRVFTGRQPRYIAYVYIETPKTWGSFQEELHHHDLAQHGNAGNWLIRKFLCTELSLFFYFIAASNGAMDVYKCKFNTSTNTKIIKI